MAYFDLHSNDFFVEKTKNGVTINHIEYVLDGNKVMDKDLHIYTVCFDTRRIKRGDDYWVWNSAFRTKPINIDGTKHIKWED